jgi:hypothetical protein
MSTLIFFSTVVKPHFLSALDGGGCLPGSLLEWTYLDCAPGVGNYVQLGWRNFAIFFHWQIKAEIVRIDWARRAGLC